MPSTATLLRTLRPLKWSQLGYRLKYTALRKIDARRPRRLQQKLEQHVQSLSERPAKSLPVLSRPEAQSKAEDIARGLLTLAGSTQPFDGGTDWNHDSSQTIPRLWQHELHYHDWLLDLVPDESSTAEGRQARIDVISRWLDDWIVHNPIGEPQTSTFAWNSYSISTRLLSWRRLFSAIPERHFDPALIRKVNHSLSLQAAHLARRIEWDLCGNHLIRDMIGLAVAVDCRSGKEADFWRRQLRKLIRCEVPEQVPSDGVHYERCPWYHTWVRHDLRWLQVLIDETTAEYQLVSEALTRMEAVAPWLEHPDGETCHFNDGNRIAPHRILDQAPRIDADREPTPRPVGGHHFTEAGFIIHHTPTWSVIFDAGPLGPDCQAGHGHADSLTLESSVNGLRLFADPGTSCYDRCPERMRDRSTQAHNTVTIDHQNSSELWDIFRIGRHAHCNDVQVTFDDHGMTASASHDGYQHLTGSPLHTRTVVQSETELRILDEISSGATHDLSGGWLLESGWELRSEADHWIAERDGTSVRIDLLSETAIDVRIVPVTMAPRMGEVLPTVRLEWSCEQVSQFTLTTRVSLLNRRPDE